MDVPGDGAIAFEVERDGVASRRSVQSQEGAVEVVGNTVIITIDVHLRLFGVISVFTFPVMLDD